MTKTGLLLAAVWSITTLGCVSTDVDAIGRQPEDIAGTGGMPSMDWVLSQWANLANWTPSADMYAALAGSGATPKTFRYGQGSVRTDCFMITFQPNGVNPTDILQMVRDDPTRVGGSGFATNVVWPPAYPRDQYDVVDLTLNTALGPKAGSIAYINSDISGGNFGVVTVDDSGNLSHPVQGTRMWGVDDVGDGMYVLYTCGIDAPTIAGTEWLAEPAQDQTWFALMQGASSYIRSLGGSPVSIYKVTQGQSSDLKTWPPGSINTWNLNRPDGFDFINSAP